MTPLTDIPTRLKADLPGFGQSSQREIVRRATEIAHIDGRTEPADADFAAAEAELEGRAEPEDPLEVPPSLEQVIATDSSFGSEVQEGGERIAPVPLDDETSVALRLVQQGLEEADHDIRLTASDENENEDKGVTG